MIATDSVRQASPAGHFIRKRHGYIACDYQDRGNTNGRLVYATSLPPYQRLSLECPNFFSPDERFAPLAVQVHPPLNHVGTRSG